MRTAVVAAPRCRVDRRAMTRTRPTRLGSLAVVVLAAGALAVPADALAPALRPTSAVATSGLGPVRIGMTKGEAERVAGTRIDYAGAGLGNCRYAAPRNRAIRASFMLIGNRVARVDVSRRGIRTPSGVRVGDSEASVRRLFASQLRVSRHEYVPAGSYLEVVPKDRKDANRRVVFETDGRRVTYIRAGRLPEVRYIEGCA